MSTGMGVNERILALKGELGEATQAIEALADQQRMLLESLSPTLAGIARMRYELTLMAQVLAMVGQLIATVDKDKYGKVFGDIPEIITSDWSDEAREHVSELMAILANWKSV